MSQNAWFARWTLSGISFPGMDSESTPAGVLKSVYICDDNGRRLLEAIAEVAIDLGEVGGNSAVVHCDFEFIETTGPLVADVDERGLAHVSGIDPVALLAGEFAAAVARKEASDWRSWLFEQGADGVLLGLDVMVPDFDDEPDDAEGV